MMLNWQGENVLHGSVTQREAPMNGSVRDSYIASINLACVTAILALDSAVMAARANLDTRIF